jgi:hypothetical protein
VSLNRPLLLPSTTVDAYPCIIAASIATVVGCLPRIAVYTARSTRQLNRSAYRSCGVDFLLDEIDEKIVNDTMISRSGVINHVELIRDEMDDIETELEKIIKIIRADDD